MSLLHGKFTKISFVLFLGGINMTTWVGASIKIHNFFFDVPPC